VAEALSSDQTADVAGYEETFSGSPLLDPDTGGFARRRLARSPAGSTGELPDPVSQSWPTTGGEPAKFGSSSSAQAPN
jgi:hypothetical protein